MPSDPKPTDEEQKAIDRKVAKRLAESFPDGKGYTSANYEALKAKLERVELQAWRDKQVAPTPSPET